MSCFICLEEIIESELHQFDESLLNRITCDCYRRQYMHKKCFIIASQNINNKCLFCNNKINIFKFEGYNNIEFVLAAVRQDSEALQYASNKLKNNRKIVLVAVRQDGLALQYASDELKNNREIVLSAVRQNGDGQK